VIIIKNLSPSIVNILVFTEITKLHGRDLLFNPFYKAPPMNISFVTYTTVANVPNGINNFKLKLTNPLNEPVHETSINAVEVTDNAFFNVMIWNNMPLTVVGEYSLTLYLATDKGFEPSGSAIIIVEEEQAQG
jgi:hypothetical protein